MRIPNVLDHLTGEQQEFVYRETMRIRSERREMQECVDRDLWQFAEQGVKHDERKLEMFRFAKGKFPELDGALVESAELSAELEAKWPALQMDLEWKFGKESVEEFVFAYLTDTV